MMLLLGGLVTWRLARMLSKEMGPLGVFARLRAYFAKNQKNIGGLYDMISCVACCSVYIGSVTALGAAHGVFSWLAYTLAFSAIATIIERFMKQTV